jgi:hypothetical protein
MAKLGFIIPRTLSNVLSTQRSGEGEPEPFYVPQDEQETEARLRRRTGGLRSGDTLPQRVVRIGRSIIPSGHGSSSTSRATSQAPTPAPLSAVNTIAQGDEEPVKRRTVNSDAQAGPAEVQRTIRFPDEPVVNRS